MVSKIRILSEQTINQIAAGEVIENPASVVKELLENAIDAGASRLTIEILGGGFQLIKISDDGSGMSPEDAALCLERHATSKIAEADDLLSLSTLGFRGEALATIAAISKFTLTTALEGTPALSLEAEGGKILSVGPAARSRGTTIEVRSLFYNVPARKKFQKSAAASSAEITKTVTQIALAHPEIGIELIQQNRSQFLLPAASHDDFFEGLKNRAQELLGEDFLRCLRPIELNEKDYKGKGLVADPLTTRHNRSGQYLFINRRPVFCLPVAYAVRDAYGTRISTDRHPLYLLHLTLSPSHVDVNVHPQKKEVRLRDESTLKYALHSAVNAALGIQVSDFSFSTAPAPDFTQPLVFKEEYEDFSPQQEIPLPPQLNIIGLFNRFLLVDAKSLSFSDSGVIWLDLAAASARLQFDSLLRNANTQPASQGLLLPLTLSFSRTEAELLRAHSDLLHKMGLCVRQAGETVFLIEAIPPFMNEGDVPQALQELLSELQGLERGKLQEEEKMRRLAGCISRRVSLRKTPYTVYEGRKLAEDLMRSSDPMHSPQGNKILFHMRENEIEDQFKN
ncbi:MAG: DNA mismatch repair endonuclease MutL [Candidatus Melainabacteria bacterium]|nr:DNA mismatch repair endonuclease MutL [Candidatus Melainabacteria bacterium]